jgi:RND family efflux transporter MFP subunit
LAVLAALVAGCTAGPVKVHEEGHAGEEGHGHAEERVELSKDAQTIAGIETTPVRLEDVQQSISVPGTVASTDRGRAVVTPPVAGRIVSIRIRLGDTVRQGQELATMESSELSQSWSLIAEAERVKDAALSDLAQARSEVGLAKAREAAAKTNLARQRELAKAGAFSQAPLQLAQTEWNDAQSDLLSVQTERASHAEQLRRLEALFQEGLVSRSELEAARLELQQDQIRLERAKARVETARAAYDREKNIASRGLLNAKELQAAEAEARASGLEVERAQIRVRAAESALASSRRAVANAEAVYRSSSGAGRATVGRVALVAPISGTVTHLGVTRGQAVERTQVLLEVEDLRSVWVLANVPEKEADKVRQGATAQVAVAALPGREFTGVVQAVGARVDPKTRAVPARCLIASAAGMLKPDMFASVRIGVGRVRKALVVPQSAVMTQGAESFVFVKEGDAYEKRQVTLGERDGSRIAVESGLQRGELVASKGAFVLSSQQQKDGLKGHRH